MDALPTLVFIAAVLVLIIAGGLFLWNLRLQSEMSRLRLDNDALRSVVGSIDWMDTPVPAAVAPPEPPVKKPLPIPEGLEVIHPRRKPIECTAHNR